MSATASYPAFVRRLFNVSGDRSKDFAHAVLGVATEVHEYLNAVDQINALEELGDLAFYGQAADQVVSDHLGAENVDLYAIAMQAAQEAEILVNSLKPLTELRHAINELLDQAKRWVGYGREPASLPAVLVDLHTVIAAARELGLCPVCQAESVDWIRIRSINMAKLLKRYPGGEFDAFRALQRDLSGERETLETAALG